MPMVGLIPFVYAAINKKRRSTARANRYAQIAAGAALGHEHARFEGDYQSRSCHFAVRPPSPADELGFMREYDDYGAALGPPPRAKGLSRELFPADRYERLLAASGREDARFDGSLYHSQSCRFAVRPSPVDELVAWRDDGASRRPPAQPEDLSCQMLLPASRHNGLAAGETRGREHTRSNGGAYQSQSCRFAVRHSAAYELGRSHDEEYSAASTSPEDLSGRLLMADGQRERRLSRSLRFSSMRVFAWARGA